MPYFQFPVYIFSPKSGETDGGYFVDKCVINVTTGDPVWRNTTIKKWGISESMACECVWNVKDMATAVRAVKVKT